MKKLFTVAMIALLPSLAFGQREWRPVSSDISFKIKNMGFAVHGKLSNLRAKLFFDPTDLTHGSLSATVDAGTIKTGIRKRDSHLKKEKFFDAEQYKRLELKSVKMYEKGARYAGVFDVTIKGVTKQIEIPFEFDQLGEEAEFKGSFTLNRRDFNVGGKSLIMADYVTVTLDVKTKR